MATKLRSFSTNIITKIVTIVLIMACAVFVVVQLVEAGEKGIDPNTLLTDNYLESNKYYINDINAIAEEISLQERLFNDRIARGVTGQYNLPSVLRTGLYDYYIKLRDGSIYQSDYVMSIGYDKFYESAKKVFVQSDTEWRVNNSHNYGTLSPESIYEVVLCDMDKDFVAEKQAEWDVDRPIAINWAIKISIAVFISLLLMIYLMIVAGRKPKDKELHLSFIDRIYSDIMLVAGILSFFFMLSGIYETMYYGWNSNNVLLTIAVSFLVILGLSIVLIVVLSLVRKMKARKLMKHSLTYVVLHFIYRTFKKLIDLLKSLFDGRAYKNYPLTKRLFYSQLAFIVGSAIAVFATAFGILLAPLFIFPLFGEVVLIYWFIKGNEKTYKEINAGFNESLDEQMKAERMKINLVTNVSHDLKTPLTSIISYVDLLSKEEDLSETAKDYVTILADKSDRLKHIVADLFDLAKATSGNIPLELEVLDVKKLIEQTVADMQDKVDSSGLVLKMNLPENPVMINSDGKKLYRVFQNIIDNALKYSLAGTRVFIDVEGQSDKVIISVKNTSGYEMDFTPKEILQRFSRGDKSRSTDGNGLGLSIAQSFTYACGGDFEVVVDGDLFKVVVTLKTHEGNK